MVEVKDGGHLIFALPSLLRQRLAKYMPRLGLSFRKLRALGSDLYSAPLGVLLIQLEPVES